ncbi:histidinol-phosphate transaminase [Poritiphilus flavus]|uniref:Histidinol-phosphate aminotransferase n=1 Tax=Poritiphilus flavus TaxID=2697053 RepID=A0A6L9EFU9_9FLAO|nr:histidinol-phosphate transaminase [Poritiphilus flavus]NAS13617.1 histidinol-phosphate transaminase [Poritiphilus flavus]
MKKDFNINDLVRENVRRLKPYSSARDDFKAESDKEMVFLDANENPFETGINRYPDPRSSDIRKALASFRGVEESQVMVGNGSDEVLDLLFRAFCEPNVDNCLTMPPTYGMYGVLAGINAIENRKVELNEDFQPRVNAVLEAQDSYSKLLFLCSPNNPTGNCFSADLIRELLEGFPGLVVIDEAYIDFSTQESWTKQLSNYSNLVVTQTLSKAYGMAGVRMGIVYASSEIIAVLDKIKPPYNVNTLTQSRVNERLRNKSIVANEIISILSEKKKLSKALLEIGFISSIYPSDANFLLIKVDDADRRYREMIDRGLVVRNRSSQPLCENTLRITIGTPEENKKLITTCKAMETWDAKYSL